MKTFFEAKRIFCNCLLFVFMICLLFCAGGCKKSGSGISSDPIPGDQTIPKSEIVGYQSNGTMNVATYWKDGAPTTLSDGIKDAQALSVSCSGQDVHIVGFTKDYSGSLYDDPTKMPKYWKNGVSVSINVFPFGVGVDHNTNGVATSVFARNGSAYIVGYMSDGGCNWSVAVIWINGGTPTFLSSPFNGDSYANSVFVTTGGDIYAAGNKSFTGGIGSQAMLWINGTEQRLTDGLVTTKANSVFVSGTDVYVCGGKFNPTTSNWMAAYWKNGALTVLTDGTTFAMANSIAVSGSDVYVVGDKTLSGISMADAVLWKNGTTTSLSKGTGSAKSIYLSGSDVYVAGYIAPSKYRAACWKNGTTFSVTDGAQSAFANSLVVR